MRTSPCRVLILTFAVTTFLIQGSCVKNPVTGGRQLTLISESQEIAIGQESHPEVLAEFGVVEDQALQDWVSRVGGTAPTNEAPKHYFDLVGVMR